MPEGEINNVTCKGHRWAEENRAFSTLLEKKKGKIER
jgi:hypothetical protein